MGQAVLPFGSSNLTGSLVWEVSSSGKRQGCSMELRVSPSRRIKAGPGVPQQGQAIGNRGLCTFEEQSLALLGSGETEHLPVAT